MGKEKKKKIIQETKCTCKGCGNIWFYGKDESQEGFGEKMQRAGDKMINSGRSMRNAGKSMMCCSGCAPAAFIPDGQKIDIKEPRDLNKCPKCGSRAVEKKIVTHIIN